MSSFILFCGLSLAALTYIAVASSPYHSHTKTPWARQLHFARSSSAPVHQGYPLVTLDDTKHCLRIRFPADRRPNPIVGQQTFSKIITVDEAEQPYKIPYFGQLDD